MIKKLFAYIFRKSLTRYLWEKRLRVEFTRTLKNGRHYHSIKLTSAFGDCELVDEFDTTLVQYFSCHPAHHREIPRKGYSVIVGEDKPLNRRECTKWVARALNSLSEENSTHIKVGKLKFKVHDIRFK